MLKNKKYKKSLIMFTCNLKKYYKKRDAFLGEKKEKRSMTVCARVTTLMGVSIPRSALLGKETAKVE